MNEYLFHLIQSHINKRLRILHRHTIGKKERNKNNQEEILPV